MRLKNFSLAFLFFVNSACGQGKSAQLAAKEIFFLKDTQHQQWCAYKNEPEWRSAMEALDAVTVGGAEYTNERVSVVHVTTTDQTGDWAVYDDYSLDGNEMLQTLKRTINVLPGRLSEEQRFRVENGRAIRLSTVTRDLDTGKPTEFSGWSWRPDLPITASSQVFPFWSLIRDKRSEILSKGKACIPDKR